MNRRSFLAGAVSAPMATGGIVSGQIFGLIGERAIDLHTGIIGKVLVNPPINSRFERIALPGCDRVTIWRE